MSTLRRLILCTALLIAFILLGAQALGMLAAHRYLNTQLAQQGQAGASALAWALSHDAAGDQDKAKLADDLFAAGTYALVRITGENGDTQVERREPAPDRPDLARDWRNGWLAMEAPAATRPIRRPTAAGSARSRSRPTPGWRATRCGRAACGSSA
ncbi:LapD/MoxY N-terminal periplasmic domain-containing protein [Achromobacter xylosoxidans]